MRATKLTEHSLDIEDATNARRECDELHAVAFVVAAARVSLALILL